MKRSRDASELLLLLVLVDLGAKQGSLELLTKAGVDLTPFVVSLMVMIIYSAYI